MSKSRNEQLLQPHPPASDLLLKRANSDKDRTARRNVVQQRNTRRDLFIGGAVLSAFAVVAGASFAAGGGRPLAHDTDQAARDAFHNRVEAVSDAFSNSNPGVVTGEPSNADAAHQAQVNEAHNAAVAAYKATQDSESK